MEVCLFLQRDDVSIPLFPITEKHSLFPQSHTLTMPSEITPFEDALIYYVMLPFLNVKRNDMFGIPEERKMTEEERVALYPALSADQKNALKRDFLIHAMTHNTVGVNKKSALLIELVKYLFPEEIEIIEKTHNDEYLTKRKVIKEQMDKLQPKKEELKKMA